MGRESGCSSGGHATALLGWQERNACMAEVLGWEGGSGHAAVLVRQWWDFNGGGG